MSDSNLTPIEVRCTDGCGTVGKMAPTDATPPGWTFLELTKRIRCPACTRALQAVNQPEK